MILLSHLFCFFLYFSRLRFGHSGLNSIIQTNVNIVGKKRHQNTSCYTVRNMETKKGQIKMLEQLGYLREYNLVREYNLFIKKKKKKTRLWTYTPYQLVAVVHNFVVCHSPINLRSKKGCLTD